MYKKRGKAGIFRLKIVVSLFCLRASFQVRCFVGLCLRAIACCFCCNSKVNIFCAACVGWPDIIFNFAILMIAAWRMFDVMARKL